MTIDCHIPIRRAATALAIGIASTGCQTDLTAQSTDGSGLAASIALGVSVERFSTQDFLVSPRPWSGSGFSQNGFVIALGSADSHHEIEGWIGTIDVASEAKLRYLQGGRHVSTPGSEADLVNASYTWLRRVTGPWWLGVAAAAQALHTRYEFGSGAAEGYLYFGALQLAGRRTIDLGAGRTLALAMRVPIVGWLARSPWSTVDESRLQADSDFVHRIRTGEAFTPADLVGVSGQAIYRHPLGRHFGIRGAIRLAYISHRTGPHYSATRAGLDLGAFIQWSGGDQ